ncbi:MAG: hypothetical protein ABR584_07105 [Candidatus Baltobacteraceae bacterium]
MEIAPQLQSALTDARTRLAGDATLAARAQTTLGPAPNDATMASLAQCAIFSEALMAAMHSRLQEIKSVTK